MPFRTDENRTTIHIITFAEMPSMVYEASVEQGIPSNTRYIQEAICRRLADDTGQDYQALLDRLPPTRLQAKGRLHRMSGPGNTVEDVR